MLSKCTQEEVDGGNIVQTGTANKFTCCANKQEARQEDNKMKCTAEEDDTKVFKHAMEAY